MSETLELEKTYNPKSVEGDIYRQWLKDECFRAVPDSRSPAERYTIVIPPPNVTGALHLGHALNNCLQDILIRFHRMMGHNTLWLPGTDHAGIATQAVVEKRIFENEGKTRHQLGREELVKRIWAWKDQYEKRILSQLQLIGCSCDWSRTRFTLDEGLARAVRHTFFKFFADGLIFRGKRLVNWDTQLQTAVSDDEVYHEKVKGHFWHFRYPVKDPRPGEPTHVIIATTRPETMLGDTAVAVHPDPVGAINTAEIELRDRLDTASAKDKPDLQAQVDSLFERRATHQPLLVALRDMANDGRKLILPLMEREIPLIADVWANPLLGSGCVKITPAHDHNDYEVGRRNNLPMINVLNPNGTINEQGGAYQGMTIADARKKVVADLEALDLIERIEDKETEIGHSDRSKSAIEPYLSEQWFLRMGKLAPAAMDAVLDGRVTFYPGRYAKSYLDWLGEKRDWCISRQLWWGHRIPVWSRTFTLTEENWTNELLPIGMDSLLGGNWGEHVAVRVERAGDGTLVEEPERAFNPVVAETAGEYRFYACLDVEDTRLIGLLEAAGFQRDNDVLDTWFSSALWPYSTLGWPDQTDDLKYYYPGSVLITSRDIITNWVARMVLTGLYNMGEIPFNHVYIHAKILDGRGETMSKSKGNGVDPLDVVEVYGADALRYSIADMATETQDVRMPVDYICPRCGHLTPQASVVPHGKQPCDVSKVKCAACKEHFATQWAPESVKAQLPVAHETSEKFEIGRNFCNKLWNSARFAFMNLEDTPCVPLVVADLPPEDRWILAKLSATIRGCHAALAGYQFSPAIHLLRDFFWDSFCDWYIELTKPRLRDPDQAGGTRQILALVMDQVLRLFSPFMPFITERLWAELNRLAPVRGLPGVVDLEMNPVLMRAAFPPAEGWTAFDDDRILAMFENIQDAVRGVRDLRNKCGVPVKQKVTVTIKAAQAQLDLLGEQKHIIAEMAGVANLTLVTEAKRPKNAGTTVVGPLQVFVHDISDDGAERHRLEKELASLDQRLAGVSGKLNNEKFVANAKPDVVASERARQAELEKSKAAVLESIANLDG